MKCPTCKDRGYIVDPAAWNLTAQELCKCPDCDTEPEDLPKNFGGLIT